MAETSAIGSRRYNLVNQLDLEGSRGEEASRGPPLTGRICRPDHRRTSQSLLVLALRRGPAGLPASRWTRPARSARRGPMGLEPGSTRPGPRSQRPGRISCEKPIVFTSLKTGVLGGSSAGFKKSMSKV